MRTYGTVAYNTEDPGWRISPEPQVMLRLKRVFDSISKKHFGYARLSDTPEHARELEWFLERYPMVISARDQKRLAAQAEEHRKTEADVAHILEPNYVPTSFELAVPPRQYQAAAADLVLRTGRLLLADDVGLGKTAVAIAMLVDPRTRPALVVTLTHLPTQWVAELRKFAPALNPYVLKAGRFSEPEADHVRKADVVITNYHKLAGWADMLACHVHSIVFDECQELRRGTASQKGAAAVAISRNTRFRLGLSATPIYNYGGEIYNVLSAIAPHALGTFDEFRREWCKESYFSREGKEEIKDPRAFGHYLRETALMLRRTRKDVGRELPAVSRITQSVDTDPEEFDRIRADITELARVVLGADSRGFEHMGTDEHNSNFERMKAGGELDYRLRRATGIAKAPYVAAFVKLLVESGEQVVLYGWHHSVYEMWGDLLDAYNPVFYTGRQSTTQKDAAKKAFLDGNASVLVMSLRAGAGLDGLQEKARTVVFGELDWSPGVLEQCIGRVHRDGQDEPVMAYFLVSEEGSDPVIADVLGLKRSQSDAIRDPDAPLLTALEGDRAHIKKLAEAWLRRR